MENFKKPNILKRIFCSFIGVSLLFSLSNCKKSQNIDDENLSGSSKQVVNNVLNITKAEFDQLKNKYQKTKQVYANEFGAIKSLANAVADVNPATPTYETALNELVSDNLLISVLNNRGEIIVDNKLYRVTPFGTFQASLENSSKLDEIVNEINNKYQLADLNLDNPNYDLSSFYQDPTASVSPDEIIELKNGIGFTPTFSRDRLVVQQPLPSDIQYGVDAGTVEPYDYSVNYPSIPGSRPSRGTDATRPPRDDSSTTDREPAPGRETSGDRPTRDGGTGTGNEPRENRPTDGGRPSRGGETTLSWSPTEYTLFDEKDLPEGPANPFAHPLFDDSNMGTKNMTNANGSFFKTIFKNATEYNYFNSEYRTSVLFYNRNYLFTKSLGIKVKHQKQGWLWWNKFTTSVVAAGWEYIAYAKKDDNILRRYYSTFIPKGNIIGAQPGQFPIDLVPNNIEILKTTTIMGETYIPLIVGNDLPIPQSVRSRGVKAIIDFVWKIIQKKIKSGEVILNENNSKALVDPTQKMENWKNRAIIFRDPETSEKYILIPPQLQFAYNTDMIDIPLDDYTAEFKPLIPILVSAVIKPKEALQKLVQWGKDEMGNSFRVNQAVVFGSSQKDGVWKGIRVIQGDDTGYNAN